MISFHRMYRLVLQIRYVQVGKCEIFCIFWTMRKPILKFETYSMVIYFKVLRVQTNAYPDRINSRQIPHLLIQFLLQTYNRVRCELTNSLAFVGSVSLSTRLLQEVEFSGYFFEYRQFTS